MMGQLDIFIIRKLVIIFFFQLGSIGIILNKKSRNYSSIFKICFQKSKNTKLS